MRVITLGTLVARAQEAIDAENQGNITPTTWKAWLSQAYGRLHSLVASTGYRYFESVHTVTTDGVNTNFTLPTDHYMSATVVRVVNATDRRRLIRASAQEMAIMPQGSTAPTGSEASRWALVGQQIYLGPQKPPAGQIYEHRYVPQPADLTGGADELEVDVVTADAETFLIYSAAAKGLRKQDKDPNLVKDEIVEAYVKIEEWAQRRALHEGHRIEDSARAPSSWRDEADWTDRHGSW